MSAAAAEDTPERAKVRIDGVSVSDEDESVVRKSLNNSYSAAGPARSLSRSGKRGDGTAQDTPRRLDELAKPIGEDGKPTEPPQPNYGKVYDFSQEEKKDASHRELFLSTSLHSDEKKRTPPATPKKIQNMAKPVKDGKQVEPNQPNYGRVINFTDEQHRDRERRERRLSSPRTPRSKPNYTVPSQDAHLQKLAEPRQRSPPPAHPSKKAQPPVTQVRKVPQAASPSYAPKASSPAPAPAPAPTRTPVGKHQKESIDRLAQPKQRTTVEHDEVVTNMKNRKKTNYGGTTVITQPYEQHLPPRLANSASASHRQPVAPMRTPVTTTSQGPRATSATRPYTAPGSHTQPQPQPQPQAQAQTHVQTPPRPQPQPVSQPPQRPVPPPQPPQPDTANTVESSYKAPKKRAPGLVKAKRFVPQEGAEASPSPLQAQPAPVEAAPVYAMKRSANPPAADAKAPPPVTVATRRAPKDAPVHPAPHEKTTPVHNQRELSAPQQQTEEQKGAGKRKTVFKAPPPKR